MDADKRAQEKHALELIKSRTKEAPSVEIAKQINRKVTEEAINHNKQVRDQRSRAATDRIGDAAERGAFRIRKQGDGSGKRFF